MKRILSFGGGLQTTALAILAAKKELDVGAAIFADPGAERPQTYSYIEDYIKPLLKEAKIPFKIIPGVDITSKSKMNIVEFYYHYRDIPHLFPRQCSIIFKRRPIHAVTGDIPMLIGFSYDEQERLKEGDIYPLVDLKLTSADCRNIITDYGWPIPLKSSCYFCPFQRWAEWNWLKQHEPELMEKALAMEARFHERKPELRETHGLFGGKPLWKYAQGIQMEMPILEEYSCWSGHCGH